MDPSTDVDAVEKRNISARAVNRTQCVGSSTHYLSGHAEYMSLSNTCNQSLTLYDSGNVRTCQQ
jgi:hypothetical protein